MGTRSFVPHYPIGISVEGVYVEPAEYRFSETPTEGDIFDLSERIAGITPIPGFTTLAEPKRMQLCLFHPVARLRGAAFRLS